jgi:hypothetical protein
MESLEYVRRGKAFESRGTANLYLRQMQVESYEIKHGLKLLPQPV